MVIILLFLLRRSLRVRARCKRPVPLPKSAALFLESVSVLRLHLPYVRQALDSLRRCKRNSRVEVETSGYFQRKRWLSWGVRKLGR